MVFASRFLIMGEHMQINGSPMIRINSARVFAGCGSGARWLRYAAKGAEFTSAAGARAQPHAGALARPSRPGSRPLCPRTTRPSSCIFQANSAVDLAFVFA